MFEKVLVTGQNDETLLPRVLRVLSKQGAQVRSCAWMQKKIV